MSYYLSFRPWYIKQEEFDLCLMSRLLNLTGRSSLLKLFLLGQTWKEMCHHWTLLRLCEESARPPPSPCPDFTAFISWLFRIKLTALFVSKGITANRYRTWLSHLCEDIQDLTPVQRSPCVRHLYLTTACSYLSWLFQITVSIALDNKNSKCPAQRPC